MLNKKVLDQIIDRILQVTTPDKIILFGSQARGDAKEDSDYDILVINAGIENERNLAKKLYRNMLGINIGVDIIVKTPENAEKSKNRFVSVVKEAFNEGIIIYE